MHEKKPAPRLVRWDTLTKTAFDRIDRRRCVVAVACSPLEVHGPHLPLGADIIESEAIAERAIRRLPPRHASRTFLLLPPVYAAADAVPHGGSLFFRPSTTTAVLVDLGLSLADQGFRDIVVSNFHGSPRHFLAIESACDRVSRARGVRMLGIFSAHLRRFASGGRRLSDVLGGIEGIDERLLEWDSHAGYVETSQLLALAPQLVDKTHASLPRSVPAAGDTPAFITLEPGAGLRGFLRSIRMTVMHLRRNTYCGAPGPASRELGERVLDRLASQSAGILADLLDGNLPPDEWHSPLWPMRHLFIHPLAVEAANRILGLTRSVG
jgi:creatinine amidohydrolase/Fe(II)-dependent formamide hydrolase-like protein